MVNVGVSAERVSLSRSAAAAGNLARLLSTVINSREAPTRNRPAVATDRDGDVPQAQEYWWRLEIVPSPEGGP